MKYKVIVTGAKGLLGSNLINNYKNKYNFYKLNNNTKNLKKKKIFKNQYFDVVHFASIHKFPYFNLESLNNYKKNIMMFEDIFKYFEGNINNFFFTSTIDCGKNKYPKYKKKYIISKIEIEKKLKVLFTKKKIQNVYILRLPAIIESETNFFLKIFLKKFINNEEIYLDKIPYKFNSITTKNDICKFIGKKIKKKSKKRRFLIINFPSRDPINFLNFFENLKRKTYSNSMIKFKNIDYSSSIKYKKIQKLNFKLTSVKEIITNYIKNYNGNRKKFNKKIINN